MHREAVLTLFVSAILIILTGACSQQIEMVPTQTSVFYKLYDSAAFAVAWIDEDGNGVWDDGEPPLEGICIYADTYSMRELAPHEPTCEADSDTYRTDHTGQWPHANDSIGGINFFAGALCSDIWIAAGLPEGYERTTPQKVQGCYGEFGFRAINEP